jgi:hypothetical protein
MSDPKIARSAEYYQLLIERCEKTGLSPRQAEVYREIKQLVLECSGLEEIQQRMKTEGFHEKPGQALYLDKMQALRKAAEDNGLPELARIYQERHDEVKADYAQAYQTGYEQRVAAFLSRQGTILGAFHEIFLNYLYAQTESVYSLLGENSRHRIREHLDKLTALGTDFARTAADPYFRAHIGLSDEAYAAFIAAAPTLAASPAGDPAALEAIETEFQGLWAILKEKKSEIQAIGRAEEARSKRAVCLAVPPAAASGCYEFSAHEQEGK